MNKIITLGTTGGPSTRDLFDDTVFLTNNRVLVLVYQNYDAVYCCCRRFLNHVFKFIEFFQDLAPYLGAVVPGLKQALLDPVPEVRAVSSRALGALVRRMSEKCFEDLLPWLMETLTSENSSVDRSGAAQGLDNVLCAMGTNRLEKLMPEVISITESKGLADESEYVRDTSLKAGQRIVNLNADTAIELFLPELEKGLFEDNWRIRHSSVQLLGDLLCKISCVTGKMSTER